MPWKSVEWEPSWPMLTDIHTYVRTYRYDKASSRLSQFGNSPKNEKEQQITWVRKQAVHVERNIATRTDLLFP